MCFESVMFIYTSSPLLSPRLFNDESCIIRLCRVYYYCILNFEYICLYESLQRQDTPFERGYMFRNLWEASIESPLFAFFNHGPIQYSELLCCTTSCLPLSSYLVSIFRLSSSSLLTLQHGKFKLCCQITLVARSTAD